MDDVKTAGQLHPFNTYREDRGVLKSRIAKDNFVHLKRQEINKIRFNSFVFQQSVALPELPAVVVFKDGGYFTYDGKLTYQIFILFFV